MEFIEGQIYKVKTLRGDIWGDGTSSVDGWNGVQKVPSGRLLEFVRWKLGDCGPNQAVFRDLKTGQCGYFSPSDYGTPKAGTLTVLLGTEKNT